MSKAVKTLEIDLPRRPALDACRVAIAGLNWELAEPDAERLSGRQDPARLCCSSAPVTVEIVVTDADERTTTIALHGKVPGFGPIAGRDLRSGLAALEAAIRRSLA